MFKRRADPGIKMEPTFSDTLLSFLLACVFGLVGLLPWLALKDAIPLLVHALGGYVFAHNAIVITVTLVFGALWLVLTMALWHRMEKDFHVKKALITTALWCLGALLLFALAIGLRWLADWILVSP